MASRVCWNCGVSSHQTMYHAPTPHGDLRSWMAPFKCDECGALSIASLQSISPSSPNAIAAEMDRRGSTLAWFPLNALGRRYEDVPSPIADAASEAHACHSIRSFRAAILMARAVIEAVAKDKGITKGTLEKKIDEMHQQQLVRELVRDTAHEIRHLGNEMAHGDFVNPVTEEESEDVLNFMAEVLNEIYQAAARLNRFRDARLAR